MSSRKRIRIAEPHLEEAGSLVLGVLRSGQLSQGPMVERFEALCSTMAGTRHAIAMSNGTVTLEAALEVLGIGKGDEVITSAFTFGATVNAILRSGATVRFADILDDFTLDPNSVADLVGPKTAAIMPVHLYGLIADMPAIEAIARGKGLAVIEDAAQAHGASINGKPAGSFGVGSFSFYATKNVTSGEGGVITTSDDDLAFSLRILRNQGSARRYEYEMVGRNLRMSDVLAAVAIPQLERLADIIDARSRNAATLNNLLCDQDGLKIPEVPMNRRHVWHQYTLLLENVDRQLVASQLATAGIESGVYYPRIAWDHDVYRRHPRVVQDPAPVADRIAATCLSIPVHHKLTVEEIRAVAAETRRAVAA